VPHGLRVDREANIWTTDNGNHVLRKFNSDGRLLTTLGTEGKPAGGKEGFRAPDDLVFDSQGNIYVADSGNGRITKLAADGTYMTEWGKKGKEPGQFATAHGLAIDSQDRIYVADRGISGSKSSIGTENIWPTGAALAIHSAYWPSAMSYWRAKGTFIRFFISIFTMEQFVPVGATHNCCCCRTSWPSTQKEFSLFAK